MIIKAFLEKRCIRVYKVYKCSTKVALILNISSLIFGTNSFFSTLLANIHVDAFLSEQSISSNIMKGSIQFPLREYEQKKGLAQHS